ncbi:hypothetical protein B0H63DRAFT_498616 [Podospora didyma]|uniref:Uncharacterized protein n=1 Tax=Podospora didyma TaxID=330526 RepID=A0AAE0P4Z3_9PEZI|nr:hypothetical protein B0H63DRAFT_498616 [Podospora didyma]
MAFGTADKSKPYVPLAGLVGDGWSKDGKATATCYYGTVLLIIQFIVKNLYSKHARGKDRIKTFSQSQTIASGKVITNYFCEDYGTLMYRAGEGFAGVSTLRISTVDGFSLHETRLRLRQEYWTKYRVYWFTGVQGVEENFEAQG